ncbi:hypothetical protein PX701_00315 [Agromyces sp. H3Y2-19a]|jgi:hypothetical protein|uniref:hypothetical protein n=1 Tax=Agromyces TaxID=33877 RepID=UPI001E620B61|nr:MULTISPECIES: hypothetical protein [Agromyces]MCD5345682.1 hypothetical protein [Agromyces sp. S2-1-8]MDF0512049.1 hypothetical protein [Agromyces chromiiresistens]
MSPMQVGPLPTIEWIADEFLHNARRGRRLIAVDGADPEASARLADELAAAVAARLALAPGPTDASTAGHRHGTTVVRSSVGTVDEATLRAELVDPFRARTLVGAEGDDVVLVVDGRHLLDDTVRGVWHFSVWTLAGDELPHSGASVIVDVSDPAVPTRYYYDYCAIPPSVNRPGLH